jgi:RNA polymerase sigma-70 factor (ECF subfamily)
MSSPSGPLTSPTLLGRLRGSATDEAAWAEFVDRYGRKIYAWARHWKLQDADAEDVAQTVLTRLARRMRTFDYDPSAGTFRGWLRTVTRHAWNDFLRARGRPGRGSGDSQVLAALESAEAGEDLAARLEQQFDQELFDAAVDRVRLRVTPSSWDAFRLTAVEGQSGAEAAGKLGMQVSAVFKARSRVQKMLRDEIRKLDGGAT